MNIPKCYIIEYTFCLIMETTIVTINSTAYDSVTKPTRVAAILGAMFITLFYIESVIGNVWILFVILTRKSMWNVMNFFVVSLCFNELLSANLNVLFVIDSYVWYEWTAGDIMCKLNPEFIMLFTGISAWHVAFMALHICIVVYHNNVNEKISWKVYVTIILIISRLVPFITFIPSTNLETSFYAPKFLRCILRPNQSARIMQVAILHTFVPCTIIILCYILVYGYAKTVKHVKISALIPHTEVQITKAFGVIFLVTHLCFLPFTIVRSIDKHSHVHNDMYVFVTVLYCIGTCSYPLIYVTICTEIRDACRSCFTAAMKKRIRPSFETISQHVQLESIDFRSILGQD